MAEQNQNKQKPQQDVNQLIKVRNEKLAELQASGNDPFQITKYDADAHSQEIKDHFDEMEGKKVSIDNNFGDITLDKVSILGKVIGLYRKL